MNALRTASHLSLVILLAVFWSGSIAAAPTAHLVDPASPTILITGANRGIGLGLVGVYAANGWNVIASCRDPARALALRALAQDNPKILIETLDVTDQAQIDALAARYRDTPIDVLFNNAAVLGAPPRQQIGDLDATLFAEVMAVNALAPLKVSQAFASHVAASGQKKIIGMTSGLGSLSMMGKMSRFYYYQMSKAALNMGMRALRNDLRSRGVIVALLAPGMVETDLLAASGFRGEALGVEDSARSLFALVAGLTIDDPGQPLNHDGKPIPW